MTRQSPPTSLFKIVDLGLSVCWADRNIGASSPEEYGEHFAWGEIETKDEYAKDNYKHLIDERGIPCIGNNISGTEHYVANQRLGEAATDKERDGRTCKEMHMETNYTEWRKWL